MISTRHTVTSKLLRIAAQSYYKVMRNILEKRTNKQKLQLQAALMSGSIRRIK